MAELLTTARRCRKPNVEHDVPADDAVEHDRHSFAACICGPKVEAIACTVQAMDRGRPVGPVRPHVFGWVVIHSSLDGREHSAT